MSDLLHMKEVLDAAWLARQAGLRDLARQEVDLRRTLLDLDDMRRGARTLPDAQMAGPRAIGADLLWQGWTQRKRQELNIELAQVLVRKAEKMAALRHAFGRAEVVRTLLDQEKTARRKTAQDRGVLEYQHLALLKCATSSGA
jgi:hypothetical protein